MDDLVFSGWLEKQGEKGFKSFKRRYCHMEKGRINYYKSKLDVTPVGIIDLDTTVVVETTGENGFRIVTPYRM